MTNKCVNGANGSLPLVSAIVTTHKREPKYVLRAINSVLTQSYPNIEIIIVDDSPADYQLRSEVNLSVMSLGIERLTYIVNDQCMGACQSRNIGITAASGAFIALLDDDDEWLPEKIEKQFMMFEDASVGLVSCDARYVYEDGRTKIVRAKEVPDNEMLVSLLAFYYAGGCSFHLIRREVFDVCGLFRENMPAAQDYEMVLRISMKYKIRFVREPLLNYHILSGDSITKNYNKKADALLTIGEMYRSVLRENPSIYYRFGERVVHVCLLSNNYKKAAKQYVKTISKDLTLSRFSKTIFTCRAFSRSYYLQLRSKVYKALLSAFKKAKHQE